MSYNDAEGNIVIAYSHVIGNAESTFEGQRDVEGSVQVEDALMNIGIGNATLPQQDDEAALRAAFEEVARAAAARM